MTTVDILGEEAVVTIATKLSACIWKAGRKLALSSSFEDICGRLASLAMQREMR